MQEPGAHTSNHLLWSTDLDPDLEDSAAGAAIESNTQVSHSSAENWDSGWVF